MDLLPCPISRSVVTVLRDTPIASLIARCVNPDARMDTARRIFSLVRSSAGRFPIIVSPPYVVGPISPCSLLRHRLSPSVSPQGTNVAQIASLRPVSGSGSSGEPVSRQCARPLIGRVNHIVSGLRRTIMGRALLGFAPGLSCVWFRQARQVRLRITPWVMANSAPGLSSQQRRQRRTFIPLPPVQSRSACRGSAGPCADRPHPLCPSSGRRI